MGEFTNRGSVGGGMGGGFSVIIHLLTQREEET